MGGFDAQREDNGERAERERKREYQVQQRELQPLVGIEGELRHVERNGVRQEG